MPTQIDATTQIKNLSPLTRLEFSELMRQLIAEQKLTNKLLLALCDSAGCSLKQKDFNIDTKYYSMDS